MSGYKAGVAQDRKQDYKDSLQVALHMFAVHGSCTHIVVVERNTHRPWIPCRNSFRPECLCIDVYLEILHR